MDVSKYHAITNDYQNVRLVSLASWKASQDFVPRDHGGPYMVVQEGYDPQDYKMRFDEFVLGKSGKWLTIGEFFRLPRETRRQEFVYGTAAEVIDLLRGLTGKAELIRYKDKATNEISDGGMPDDLNDAFLSARNVSGAPETTR